MLNKSILQVIISKRKQELTQSFTLSNKDFLNGQIGCA